MQIFYPYSIQKYPNKFPGQDSNDCPKSIKKEEALKFVHAVLRQTKDGNGNGLLGFDAAY